MITSVNLCGTPFQSNTDSTRLQMASKQIQQSLTHINCEIPYVIDNNFNQITNYSNLGILLSPTDGKILYRNDDIIICDFGNKIQTYEIPPIKKTHGIYSSSLRNALNTGDKFKKGDVIWEYDCFNNGIPSWGYNVFSAYNVFFGFNHEDSMVLSESFADRARVNRTEKIFIPIYDFTILDPIYNSDGNFIYFPGIGQKIYKNILCQMFIPKNDDNIINNTRNLKNKVIQLLKSLNVSDCIQLDKDQATIDKFKKDTIKTKIKEGILSGFRIHKLNKNVELIDKRLQNVLEKMYKVYNNFLFDTYTDFNEHFSQSFSKQLLKKYYVYTSEEDNRLAIKNITIKDCVYILEFEINRDDKSTLGDKFTNRYAGKGVCSLVLPDELRPIALNSNTPIDLSFNPFSVYSRMNMGQIIDGAIAKTVMFCDKTIKEDDNKTEEVVSWLNENVIKHLGEEHYYDRVKNEIINNLTDSEFRKKFIKNIMDTNLFIEGPCFSRIDLNKLVKNIIDPNEPVLIKKETIQFIKDRLKIKNDFVITSDVIRNNIFCAPMYVNKLYKLAEHIINTRDFGPVKDITQQPLRGRAAGGGSRLGQMEIEALLAHGCDQTVKELFTVKSDHNDEKKNLIKQVIESGDYDLPENLKNSGRTKKIVSTILKFLKE